MARRNTVQQTVIAEKLGELHGMHPTADDVYAAVAAQYPTISKATVYRTLNRMSEDGCALKVPVAGGADRFDDTLVPHYHVQCVACGRVDDVCLADETAGLDLCGMVTAPGYELCGYDLLFRGLCPACKKACGTSQV